MSLAATVHASCRLHPLGLALSVCLMVVTGCSDPCDSSDDPQLILGTGVGGAFSPIADDQDVGLEAAPQGGFGVTTLLRTLGLSASDTSLANAQLDVLIDGELEGSFLLTDARLLCRSDGEGGEISGVVVGFDPDVYITTDDLLALNGQSVELDVTVTDETGNSAQALKPVTVVYGDQD